MDISTVKVDDLQDTGKENESNAGQYKGKVVIVTYARSVASSGRNIWRQFYMLVNCITLVMF